MWAVARLWTTNSVTRMLATTSANRSKAEKLLPRTLCPPISGIATVIAISISRNSVGPPAM